MNDQTMIAIGMFILAGGAFIDPIVRMPAVIALGIITGCAAWRKAI